MPRMPRPADVEYWDPKGNSRRVVESMLPLDAEGWGKTLRSRRITERFHPRHVRSPRDRCRFRVI